MGLLAYSEGPPPGPVSPVPKQPGNYPGKTRSERGIYISSHAHSHWVNRPPTRRPLPALTHALEPTRQHTHTHSYYGSLTLALSSHTLEGELKQQQQP